MESSMAPIDHDASDRFDAVLEALAKGRALPPVAGAADLVAAARRLRALDDAQSAPPGLADQIWDELMNQVSLPSTRPVSPASPTARPALNGKSAPHPWRASASPPAARDRRRWTMSQLALAAILVVTLAASLIARQVLTPEAPTTLIEAPRQPAVETFLDATVESESDAWVPISVERWTIQPGPATLTIPAIDGLQWIAADGGEILTTIGGEERRLPAGDAIVVAAGQDLVLSNPGPGEVAVMRGVAGMVFSLEEYDPAAITMAPILDTDSHEALPPGASRIVLERLTLEPGASLATEPRAGQDLIDVVSGVLGLTLVGDGLPQGWRSGREREVDSAEPLPALVPGTRVTLRNVGEEPLVLLRLRVLPLSETGP
jgi:hypothetical protein